MNRGILFAIGAYLAWGFLPVYWKALVEVPAIQILGHRVVWSFLLLAILITFLSSWDPIKKALVEPRLLFIFGVAALLLSANWLTYIWGVNSGFIVETSLGYFINPLVNVLLGVLFLREKLRVGQWIAIGTATFGVLYLTFAIGRLPWIALLLAFTFGFYALVKKTSSFGSLQGLTIETAILFIPALAFLIFAELRDQGAFSHISVQTDILLIFTGAVTAIPLLLFGSAAQKINLSTLGILQYLAPSIQFLIGVGIYKEPFTTSTLTGFIFIWFALALYSAEGYFTHRKSMISTQPSR
jgi:chloramphenicol-sensitive protein RarD